MTGCRRTSRKAVEDARRVFFLFFFSFTRNKRKDPSSPRPPHIFKTRFVLHFFSFFSFLLLLLPSRTGASRKVLRRAHACFVTVITIFSLFALSLSLSLYLYLSLLSHYHDHHPIRLLVLSSLCAFPNRFADIRSIET